MEKKRIEEHKKRIQTEEGLNQLVEDQYMGMDEDDNSTVQHLKSLMTHGAKAGKGRLLGQFLNAMVERAARRLEKDETCELHKKERYVRVTLLTKGCH